MQMVMGAVLIDALHTTLEDCEKHFDGIGIHSAVIPRNILAVHMAHNVMSCKFAPYQRVDDAFVGHEFGFPSKVGADDRRQGASLHIINNDATGLATVAVNER